MPALCCRRNRGHRPNFSSCIALTYRTLTSRSAPGLLKPPAQRRTKMKKPARAGFLAYVVCPCSGRERLRCADNSYRGIHLAQAQAPRALDQTYGYLQKKYATAPLMKFDLGYLSAAIRVSETPEEPDPPQSAP